MKVNQWTTGEIIKRIRELMELTQSKFGEKLGVTDKTVSKWERNDGLPDTGMLKPLAEFLGISIDFLITGIAKTDDDKSIECSMLCTPEAEAAMYKELYERETGLTCSELFVKEQIFRKEEHNWEKHINYKTLIESKSNDVKAFAKAEKTWDKFASKYCDPLYNFLNTTFVKEKDPRYYNKNWALQNLDKTLPNYEEIVKYLKSIGA